VLENVLVNARDALMSGAQEHPAVEVRAEEVDYFGDPWVSITVRDNGPGIPIEIQDKIFEPFFTTKPAGEGSGLGLDIVRKIVEKHEGSIDFESKPGRTTFFVRLPANF